MDHDHSATPAIYEGTCDDCRKPLRRVFEHRAWRPEDPDEDDFPIECRNCGAHSMAYRVFPDEKAA